MPFSVSTWFPSTRSRTLCSVCSTATVFALLGAAPPATAQETVYDGSKARVFLSANLRSLGEQAAATACHASLDPTLSAAVRKDATTIFDLVVAGLRDGDPALGVPGPEGNGRIVRRLDEMEAAWKPIRAVAEGAPTVAALSSVADTHGDLMESAEVLLADMSGRYSNPQELLQVDAVALNFMGRQSKLLAQMDRIVCGMTAGIDGFGTPEELAEAIATFDATLIALRDGFPQAGINPPRTEAVSGELAAMHTRWTEARGVFDALARPGSASSSDIALVSALTTELSDDMRNVVTLTMISSPGQRDVYKVPLAAYVERELASWLTDPVLIAAIHAQNAAHAGLKDEDIEALDLDWRAQAKAGGGVLVDDLMTREASLALADRQLGSAGFITEAFVMDNRGLNVAQSAVTSDYWQGDEAKWQETYGRDDGGLHISEVEFDDSTGYYQTQASMPVLDPATGEKIGAVTFGVNVQRLM